MSESIQRKIREEGSVVHVNADDSDLNKDGLPVYFEIEIAKNRVMVVDKMARDEIGVIDHTDRSYFTINEKIAELILDVIHFHESKTPMVSPYPHKGIDDWWDKIKQPYEIKFISKEGIDGIHHEPEKMILKEGGLHRGDNQET